MPKIPYMGGSKEAEKAILRWQRMNPMERAEILKVPSVQSQRTMKGKFWKAIDVLKRR